MIVVHRKITWLLIFSILSLVVASWLIYLGKNSQEKTSARINQTHEIIEAIQQLSYLAAQPDARNQQAEIHQQMDTLTRLTQDIGDQQPQVQQLRQYLAQASLDTAIIFPHLSTMMHEERRLLSFRRTQGDMVNKKTAYGLLLGRAAGFTFIVIILLQLNSDITRRKKVQVNLERAILEAHEARQMQEQFLANMSHEIRTPMNGIKGMTELLLDTPLSQKQHELAGTIKSSANNLLVILNDILDFSKIKAGKLNIEKIEFSLREVLNNTVSIFEHRLKKKGLQLHVEMAEDIPACLTGDPYRLSQILINLLGNAKKFTDKGEIKVRVAAQSRTDKKVVVSFSITDTGIGISRDNLPFIFDSFSQAGSGGGHRYGGTGLGLTICKQLLQLQEGDITVDSTPGKGSVFSFYLPYEYSDKPVAGQPAAAPLHDYSSLLTGRRFLVAEDNEINQRLIDYVLTRAGGTVQVASNGIQAIDCLQDSAPFDLIIMDLQMPEMDGYATTKYIRKDLRMDIPIIAMTATAMAGEQLQCLQSGMNDYMTKPFEFADLYKRINSLLSLTPATDLLVSPGSDPI